VRAPVPPAGRAGRRGEPVGGDRVGVHYQDGEAVRSGPDDCSERWPPPPAWARGTAGSGATRPDRLPSQAVAELVCAGDGNRSCGYLRVAAVDVGVVCRGSGGASSPLLGRSRVAQSPIMSRRMWMAGRVVLVGEAGFGVRVARVPGRRLFSPLRSALSASIRAVALDPDTVIVLRTHRNRQDRQFSEGTGLARPAPWRPRHADGMSVHQ
jgi:hypothetical protein